MGVAFLHGEALLFEHLLKTAGALLLLALVFYAAWDLTGRGGGRN